MTNIKQVIGAELRRQRKIRKMSQEELAKVSDVHSSYIGQVERGEKNLTIESLERILQSLNLSFSLFFQEIEQTRNNDNNNIQNQIYSLIKNVGKEEKEVIYKLMLIISANEINKDR